MFDLVTMLVYGRAGTRNQASWLPIEFSFCILHHTYVPLDSYFNFPDEGTFPQATEYMVTKMTADFLFWRIYINCSIHK